MQTKCSILIKVKDWGYFAEKESSNQKESVCGSIPKKLESTQKGIYDNLEKKLILCDVDRRFPQNTIQRTGSHEQCLAKYLKNAGLDGSNMEEKVMFRSTRLTKGATGQILHLESFSAYCRIQSKRVYDTINDLEKRGWIDRDDLIHVNLVAQDCHEKFTDTPLAVKERLKEKHA